MTEEAAVDVDVDELLLEEHDRTSLSCIHLAIIMLAHVVCFLFTGFIIYISQPGTSLFSWHPALMAIAFSFLLIEAVLSLSPRGSLLGAGLSRGAKFQLHRACALAGLGCALAGSTAVWLNKERKGRSHYTSWHGLLGLVTVCYTLLQCCAGMLVRYPGLIPRAVRPPALRMYHATSGLALTALACATVALGLCSNWFVRHVSGAAWYVCLAAPAVLAVIVMKQVNGAYMSRGGRGRGGKATAAK